MGQLGNSLDNRVVVSLCQLVLPLIYIPIFFTVPDLKLPMSCFWGGADCRGDVRIHFNIVACLAGMLLWFRTTRDTRIKMFVTFSLAWLTVPLVGGLFVSYSIRNVLFFIQTILPLFAMFYGVCLSSRTDSLRRFVELSIWATPISVVALWIVSLVVYGPHEVLVNKVGVIQSLAIGFPQVQNYYPVVVLATFSIVLARFLFAADENATPPAIALALHLLFIPICWSRTAILGFFVCVFLQYCVGVVLGKSTTRKRMLLLATAVILAAAVSECTIGSTILERFRRAEDHDRAYTVREQYFHEGLDRIRKSPLLGDMFIPVSVRAEFRTRQLFPAHNQYIDWALRGGVLYLSVVIVFMCYCVRSAIRLFVHGFNSGNTVLITIGVSAFSLLISLAVCAPLQLYFIQLATAVPIFTLIGVVLHTQNSAVELKSSLLS